MRIREKRRAASTRENARGKTMNDLCRRKRLRSDARPRSIVLLFIVSFLALLSFPEQGTFVLAADDDYNNNQYQDDAANNDDAVDDDANNNQGDDAVANDDAANQGDDFYADDDANAYEYEGDGRGQYIDDDTFHWDANVGFDGVSVIPISCINYNNGHMIKFQLFDTANSYQCHFAEISTFVVSIAHYMRAYFNYQALTYGRDFELPYDAGYLNCVQLQATADSGVVLYAKVGCMERETFTSTKLQLKVYTDAQCSQEYDDGLSARKHSTKGYQVGNKLVSSKVSFRPPFYSCLTCAPEQISGTFNKKNGNWYDDDYISEYGKKQGNNDGEGEDENNAQGDDYIDDQYMAANDDVARNDDQYNDDANNNRLLSASESDLRAYRDEFWEEFDEMQMRRKLYDNYYDIGEWNMCQRIYKYGVWCDEECRSLDFFRTDQWSGADVFLLVVMCVFLTAMMLLVVAKRLKAQQKAKIYGEEHPLPGLPPLGMAIIFAVTMAVIVILAKLKFINETLVFAVVTCILLFIYMLKLTLFEARRPVLLAAPRHDMFDNPLDEHLFD